MNRQLLTAGLIVACLLGLVGCTSTTTGTGTPTPASTSSPHTTSGATLRSIDPCGVVSPAVLSQNKLVTANQPATPGARSCTWQRKTDQTGPGYVLGIDIRDSQGLADVNSQGFTVTDDAVGGHSGKQAQGTEGDGCFVALGVTPTSRVDVVVSTSDSDASRSCSLANRFAKLVEPKLP